MTRRAFIASLGGIGVGVAMLTSGTRLMGDLFSKPTVPELKTAGVLVFNGLVQHTLNLTLDDLKAMPMTVVQASVRCVAADSFVTAGSWGGVRLSYLLDLAGVSESAVKLVLRSSDGFSTDLPSAIWRADDMVIAFEKDGELLPRGPRLIAPGLWGYKCLDLLSCVALVDYDYRGVYESLGYSDTGLFGSLLYLDTSVPSVPYAVNGSTFETDVDGSSLLVLEDADYTISVPPDLDLSEGRTVHFAHWEDGSTSPARSVSLSGTTVLSASYE